MTDQAPSQVKSSKIRRMSSVFRRKSSSEKPLQPFLHPNANGLLPEIHVNSSEVPANPSPQNLRHNSVASKCYCCCMVLTYPADAQKYRCIRCNTTNIVAEKDLSDREKDIHPISVNHLRTILDSCFAAPGPPDHHLHPTRDLCAPF